jgi:hypothetical protein
MSNNPSLIDSSRMGEQGQRNGRGNPSEILWAWIQLWITIFQPSIWSSQAKRKLCWSSSNTRWCMVWARSENEVTQSGKYTESPMEPNLEHTEDPKGQLDPDRSGYNGCDHEFDDPLDLDIEDFLPNTPEDIDEDAEPETFSK